MTKENSRRLYDHYVEIGYDKAAEDLLRKYPMFKDDKPKAEPKEVQGGDDKGTADSKSNPRKKK